MMKTVKTQMLTKQMMRRRKHIHVLSLLSNHLLNQRLIGQLSTGELRHLA